LFFSLYFNINDFSLATGPIYVTSGCSVEVAREFRSVLHGLPALFYAFASSIPQPFSFARHLDSPGDSMQQTVHYICLTKP